MKIIVIDHGWLEYNVPEGIPFDALLDRIQDLYLMLPKAEIYLDWKDNVLLVDSEILGNHMGGPETLN